MPWRSLQYLKHSVKKKLSQNLQDILLWNAIDDFWSQSAPVCNGKNYVSIQTINTSFFFRKHYYKEMFVWPNVWPKVFIYNSEYLFGYYFSHFRTMLELFIFLFEVPLTIELLTCDTEEPAEINCDPIYIYRNFE
jgi:hypothetical protein